jgi:hypothetical protein
MHRRSLLAFSVCTVVALAACGCDDVTPRDAGSADGGHLDAGRRDAGRRDAGRRDAGSRDSGSPDGDDPGWVPLTFLPAGCVIERAEHPERLLTPEWASCGEGCQYLLPDPRFQRAISSRAGWHDGTRAWFVAIQETGDDKRMVVIAPTDGSAVAAWRDPPASDPGLCLTGNPTLGDGYAAVMFETGFDGLPRRSYLFHAPLDTIGGLTWPVATVDDSILRGEAVFQRAAVSGTTVAAELQPAGLVYVFEGSAYRPLGGIASAVPGIPQNPAIVGQTVFWEDWGTRVSPAYGSMTEDAAYLRQIDGDIKSFHATPEGFAWVEGYDRQPDGSYARVELWTAPFTDDPATLAPRFVRELPYRVNGAPFGGGIVAIRKTDPHRIDLYDVADGRLRRFLPPEGLVLTRHPVYVTDSEMLLAEAVGTTRTLYRIDITTLPYIE